VSLSVPQPGWIAVNLAPSGMAIALSTLGLGITLSDGKGGDEEIADFYAALAADYDPVWTLTEHYVDLEARYPFLLGWLAPLTKWTEQATDFQAGEVSRCAKVLSTVSFSGAEEEAFGDLFSRVFAHLNTAGYKRSVIFDYTPPDFAELMMHIRNDVIPEGGSFTDLWCGTGTRVIAMASAMRRMNRDPHKAAWRLNTPNPTELAMAGLNCVAADLGQDVALACDRQWSEVWAASFPDPYELRSMPPEARDMIKALKGRDA
jgi:hypothetical protein